MSWIAEYDTHGREFPTCVHVTKTTGTMTHGATYVPIEDGKAVRIENAKLRELCKEMMAFVEDDDACERCGHDAECVEAADGELVLPYEGRCLMLDLFADRMRELGVEVG
jgi:hypothetical protein